MTNLDERPDRDTLKTAMTAAWDHGAHDYDSQWAHGLRTDVERTTWIALLERLVPPLPRARILDVGAGTGFLALLLAEIGHDVTCLDLSAQMLSVARDAAARRKLDMTFVLGDAEAPLAELVNFDVVITRHVLWTLQQPEVAVRAWAEALRPGGRVIVIDGIWQPRALSDRVLALAGRQLARLHPTRHRDHHYPAQTRGHLPLQHLTNLDPARNVLARAGLEDVRGEELTWIDDVDVRSCRSNNGCNIVRDGTCSRAAGRLPEPDNFVVFSSSGSAVSRRWWREHVGKVAVNREQR